MTCRPSDPPTPVGIVQHTVLFGSCENERAGVGFCYAPALEVRGQTWPARLRPAKDAHDGDDGVLPAAACSSLVLHCERRHPPAPWSTSPSAENVR
jgi:hypothetical protein